MQKHIFQRNLRNHALVFGAFGRKTQFIENFEKIFENFSKIFFRKLLQIPYLSIFFKKLTNHALIFARLDDKRKSIRNFENS